MTDDSYGSNLITMDHTDPTQKQITPMQHVSVAEKVNQELPISRTVYSSTT